VGRGRDAPATGEGGKVLSTCQRATLLRSPHFSGIGQGSVRMRRVGCQGKNRVMFGVGGKEETRLCGPGFFAGLSCWERLKQPRCTAGISPAEAAYSSPFIQSDLVTNHLLIGEHAAVHSPVGSGDAQPSRGWFEGDCRSTWGCDSRRATGGRLSVSLYLPAAGLSFPGTPSRGRCHSATLHLRLGVVQTSTIRRGECSGSHSESIFSRSQ
jgi:hypothetical protein